MSSNLKVNTILPSVGSNIGLGTNGGNLNVDGGCKVQVGTALTLGHTVGVQFATQNLHSTGFEVNQINASGIITASHFYGSGANLTGVISNIVEDSSPQLGGGLASNGFNINFADSSGTNNMAKFGASGDLQIYHDSAHSRIVDTGTGDLKLQTSKLTIGNVGNSETMASFTADGAVQLNYDNVSMFETESRGAFVKKGNGSDTTFTVGSTDASGVRICLDGDSNGDAYGNDYAFLQHDSSGDFIISADNPAGNSNLIFKSGNSSERARITSNGHILLGTSTDYADVNSDDVQIYSSGDTGISITSGTSHFGSIYFGDATSGDARNAGIIRYNHSVDAMEFWTNQGEKVRINSSGQMGLGISTPQANAKLQVVGRVGATEFYTTTTSSPQTDFTSSQASNKAGLLLHRTSETNGDYCGLEFHTHPSSITSYRKGGIYYQANGTGFGRGDIVFANDNAGDSGLVTPADHKFRISNDGSLRAYTNSNAVSCFSNYEHGNVDFSHRDNRLLHSNGTGWDGNTNGDGTDPILVLAVENRAGNSDIGDAMGLVLHSESQDDNDYAPLLAWSVRSNSGNYNTTIAAIVAQKKGQAVDHNWSSGDLHFFTNKPSGTQGGYMNNVADMTITQHGYVTMPRQPAFSATTSVTRSAGNIVFNQTSCNVGGHYSTSNGRFTAPVAGTYYFSFYGMSPHNSTNNQRVAIRVNGNYWSGGQYVGGVGYSGYTNNGYTHLTLTTALTLSVNDYVQIDWQYDNLHDGHCKFTGFLIG